MGSTQGTAVRGDVRSRPRGRRHRLVVSHRGDPRERVDRRLLGEVPRAVLRRAASPDRGYPPTADRAGWAPAVLAIAAVVVSVAPQLAVDAIVQGPSTPPPPARRNLRSDCRPTSPPVAMSAVAVLGGFSAYPLRGRLAAGIRRGVDAPIPVRPSGWYDWIVSTAEVTSARFGSMVHNGLLRTYVGWVAAAGSLLALAGFAAAGGPLEIGGIGVPLAVAVVLGSRPSPGWPWRPLRHTCPACSRCRSSDSCSPSSSSSRAHRIWRSRSWSSRRSSSSSSYSSSSGCRRFTRRSDRSRSPVTRASRFWWARWRSSLSS